MQNKLAALCACAALLAACSESPQAPVPQQQVPSASVVPGSNGNSLAVGSSKLQTYHENGATIVVALTDVGDGKPSIQYILRQTPNGGPTFVTFQFEGKLIQAKRLKDGTTTFSGSTLHYRTTNAACDARWLDLGKQAHGTAFDGCDIGGVSIDMVCNPDTNDTCDSGGDSGGTVGSYDVCCRAERDKYWSEVMDVALASGAVALACVPNPFTFACALATANYTRQVWELDMAKMSLDVCRSWAQGEPKCKSIAFELAYITGKLG